MALGVALRALPAAAFLSLAILSASPAARSEETRAAVARGPLDGMAFVGKLGPASDPDTDDVLYFADGHFWSRSCTRLGIAPGPYWARTVGADIEFRGELESRDRGRFSYLGRVREGRVTASINWRRERWYWSIDRNWRFEGALSAADGAGMSLEAARGSAARAPRNPD